MRRGHRTSTITIFVFLLLATGPILAACGGSDGSEGASSPDGVAGGDEGSDGDVCTADRVGGAVTMGMFSEAVGLDPIVQFGSGVAGGIETAAIYDRLMRWEPETGAFTPRLAESLEANADSTVWTLKLRPEAVFGNGDPVTADAVKFSIERTQSDANRTQSRGAAAVIDEVVVIDPLTAEFRLTEEWAGFPALLADEPGMVVNPAVVQSMSPEEFNANPLGAGAGAYEPARFAPGDEIVLRAKQDWWGGPVCIEELRFIWIPGARATYDAFQVGELEVALFKDPIIAAEADSAEVASFDTLQNLGDVLQLNNHAPRITSDVRIRQAIAHAVDPEAVNQRAFEGEAIATSALIGQGSLYYDPAIEGPEYNPDKARALVDEVKAETGWDGSIGFICDNTPSRREQALSVDAQLRAVGFQPETDSNLNQSDLITRTRVQGDYEIACYGFNVNDASPWLRMVSKFGPGGATTEVGYETDEMNAVFDELRMAESVEEIKAVLADMQEIWNRDVPVHNLLTAIETIIWSDDVHGLELTSKAVVFFDKAYLAS